MLFLPAPLLPRPPLQPNSFCSTKQRQPLGETTTSCQPSPSYHQVVDSILEATRTRQVRRCRLCHAQPDANCNGSHERVLVVVPRGFFIHCVWCLCFCFNTFRSGPNQNKTVGDGLLGGLLCARFCPSTSMTTQGPSDSHLNLILTANDNNPLAKQQEPAFTTRVTAK